MEAAGAWGRAGPGWAWLRRDRRGSRPVPAPARVHLRGLPPGPHSPGRGGRPQRAWGPQEQGRHYARPRWLPPPQPARTSAGDGRAAGRAGRRGPRGGADGGDAGWRRSRAHRLPAAEGLKMETWQGFSCRGRDSVAPRQRSYLYLPAPFPPPSWCGARRLGDAHHKPCGAREPGLREGAP